MYEYVIATTTTSGLLIIPTVVLNTAVLFTIWKTPSLQKPSNVFLCNLAVSDFALATLGVPSAIAWMTSHYRDTSHSTMCNLAYLSTILSSIFACVSFLTIAAATMDRYLALTLHLSYASLVTVHRVVVVCVGIWIFCVAISFSLLAGLPVYCWSVSPSLFACSMVMTFCYSKIFAILRRHHNQIQSQICWQQEHVTLPNVSRLKKTIFNLIYICGLCIVLYTPYISAMIAHEVIGDSVPLLKYWLCTIPLIFANSTLNPIVYCWRLGEIRNAIKERWREIKL